MGEVEYITRGREKHHQRCFNCHELGHTLQSCLKPPMILCYNCHAIGHKTYECKSAKRCHLCGENGHLAKACTNRSNKTADLLEMIGPGGVSPGGVSPGGVGPNLLAGSGGASPGGVGTNLAGSGGSQGAPDGASPIGASQIGVSPIGVTTQNGDTHHLSAHHKAISPMATLGGASPIGTTLPPYVHAHVVHKHTHFDGHCRENRCDHHQSSTPKQVITTLYMPCMVPVNNMVVNLLPTVVPLAHHVTCVQANRIIPEAEKLLTALKGWRAIGQKEIDDKVDDLIIQIQKLLEQKKRNSGSSFVSGCCQELVVMSTNHSPGTAGPGIIPSPSSLGPLGPLAESPPGHHLCAHCNQMISCELTSAKLCYSPDCCRV